MDFKDYYKILGVEPDADAKAIKASYRKLARKTHPDLNPGKESEEKFKEIAEAYEVLKSAERRAEYDELRRYGASGAQGGFKPPPDWQSRAAGGSEAPGSDFSDFFNSMFGGGFRSASGSRGGQGRSGFGIRGQDIEIEMPVFLEETLADTRKPIAYEIPVQDAQGVRRVRKSLQVTIPADSVDGSRVRVKGQGAPGVGDAPAGDLYLHIRLVPHPLFDVEGHNLVVTVPIAPWEAALGAKVTVPTLDGKISLTIKAGSQAGQKLRIKGRGLRSKAGRGDLFALLKVVMPATNDADSDKLWRDLAARADFDPRAEWETSA